MMDLFIAVFSGVLLLFIERLLLPKTNLEENIVREKVIKPEIILIKEKEARGEKKEKVNNSNDSMVWIILLLGIAAVACYIKYYMIIHSIFLIVSIATGIMAIGMALFCIKKGMRFKGQLNFVLIVNALSLIIVPWIISLTTNANVKQGIDIEVLKKQAESGNMFGSADSFDVLFLLYQLLGLATLLVYVLLVFVSNIYLVSLINVNLNSKFKFIWTKLLQQSYRFMRNPILSIILECIFIVMSYLLISGTVWNWVNR